jgi:hypothetical protein
MTSSVLPQPNDNPKQLKTTFVEVVLLLVRKNRTTPPFLKIEVVVLVFFSFRYISEPVIDITNIVITRYMQHHNNYD